MKIYRLLSLGLLFVFITFGALGGCGSSGDGDDGDEIVIELICDDGLDNDDNGFTDCEDLACVIDPACIGPTCEDFVNIFCNRVDECIGEIATVAQIFDDCVIDISEVVEETMYCNDFEESSTAQECLDDYAEFDCDGVLFGAAPESCEQEGICEPCLTDDDCALGQICGDFGIGGPFLCASEFFTTFCPIL